MRAVVVGSSGEPELAELSEPDGPGEALRVLACRLCGSEIEKLVPASAGRVLGHEVVGETASGRHVVAVHHAPCGECERCRAGHESTCSGFQAETIVPGGFAERISAAAAWVDAPESVDDARATAVEPLACVLRGAERVPRGRALVIGQGFVGRLFRRGARSARGRPVRARPATRVARAAPRMWLLCFADAGTVALDPLYRHELTIVGSRSATPRHMETAVALLPQLDLPAPTVLPLARFAEGLELQRSGDVLKVVFVP